jgi:hypothetical protein
MRCHGRKGPARSCPTARKVWRKPLIGKHFASVLQTNPRLHRIPNQFSKP